MIGIHFRHLVVVIGATAILGLSASLSHAQQLIVMKFATLTINDVQHEYMKNFKATLEKRTNNRIRVDLYPAAQKRDVGAGIDDDGQSAVGAGPIGNCPQRPSQGDHSDGSG